MTCSPSQTNTFWFPAHFWCYLQKRESIHILWRIRGKHESWENCSFKSDLKSIRFLYFHFHFPKSTSQKHTQDNSRSKHVHVLNFHLSELVKPHLVPPFRTYSLLAWEQLSTSAQPPKLGKYNVTAYFITVVLLTSRWAQLKVYHNFAHLYRKKHTGSDIT